VINSIFVSHPVRDKRSLIPAQTVSLLSKILVFFHERRKEAQRRRPRGGGPEEEGGPFVYLVPPILIHSVTSLKCKPLN